MSYQDDLLEVYNEELAKGDAKGNEYTPVDAWINLLVTQMYSFRDILRLVAERDRINRIAGEEHGEVNKLIDERDALRAQLEAERMPEDVLDDLIHRLEYWSADDGKGWDWLTARKEARAK